MTADPDDWLAAGDIPAPWKPAPETAAPPPPPPPPQHRAQLAAAAGTSRSSSSPSLLGAAAAAAPLATATTRVVPVSPAQPVMTAAGDAFTLALPLVAPPTSAPQPPAGDIQRSKSLPHTTDLAPLKEAAAGAACGAGQRKQAAAAAALLPARSAIAEHPEEGGDQARKSTLSAPESAAPFVGSTAAWRPQAPPGFHGRHSEGSSAAPVVAATETASDEGHERNGGGWGPAVSRKAQVLQLGKMVGSALKQGMERIRDKDVAAAGGSGNRGVHGGSSSGAGGIGDVTADLADTPAVRHLASFLHHPRSGSRALRHGHGSVEHP
eukprot:SM002631S09987  [mRNA]  locus=s2631:583:1551:- [translate_table: standard]